MSEDGGPKSVVLSVRVWLNDEDRRIRMVFPDGEITTVAEDKGERRHPHLYNHLRGILKKHGKWPNSMTPGRKERHDETPS